MARPEVVVVRHGQTEWSRDGRHTGRTDLPLLPEGEEQAAALAPALASRDFALVLTSPLERARRTLELAGVADAEVDPDLLEWDYGEFEGVTTAQVREERPGWSIWHTWVGGGEQPAEVARRADRVIARVREVDGDVLLGGHGHALRYLAARWVGLPAAAAQHLVLHPATVSVLGWEREAPAIVQWNAAPEPA